MNNELKNKFRFYKDNKILIDIKTNFGNGKINIIFILESKLFIRLSNNKKKIMVKIKN